MGEILADNVTTLTLRCLSPHLTVQMLLQKLDDIAPGMYDFVYLPTKKLRQHLNLGLAFINFVHHQAAKHAYAELLGMALSIKGDRKVPMVAAANVQGLAKNLEHYAASSGCDVKNSNPPLVFINGVRVDLPDMFRALGVAMPAHCEQHLLGHRADALQDRGARQRHAPAPMQPNTCCFEGKSLLRFSQHQSEEQSSCAVSKENASMPLSELRSTHAPDRLQGSERKYVLAPFQTVDVALSPFAMTSRWLNEEHSVSESWPVNSGVAKMLQTAPYGYEATLPTFDGASQWLGTDRSDEEYFVLRL
eukprot:TRINITY_DN10014_c0_g3_i1.p1 TRINITY_DN10014_c0_g3~~TRINITY_DN10014_c0_g3_i1.p1  ORF type:complete len:332 (+),score=51.49 TRINITY_DN10014_c0_g3_i1:83-997(+)